MNYYREIKNLIEEKTKYDYRLIKKWSEKLTKKYGNNYSYRNLNYMRKFYIYFKKMNALCSQSNLSWRIISIYLSLIMKTNEIKTKSFDRLSYADKKNIKLITDKENNLDIKDMIHDPILINIDQTEKISEKV